MQGHMDIITGFIMQGHIITGTITVRVFTGDTGNKKRLSIMGGVFYYKTWSILESIVILFY